MRKRKAFVFTLEAAIGVIIGSAILTGFFAFYGLPSQQTTLHHRTATDALYILDEENVLTGTPATDQQQVNDTLQDIVPPAFNYQFNITYLDVTAGGGLSDTGQKTSFSTLDAKSDVVFDIRPILIFDTSGQIPELDTVARVKVGVSP